MITLVKQNFEERVAMYAKHDKQTIIGYLETRDETCANVKKYHENNNSNDVIMMYTPAPSFLIYNNYNKLSHKFLCELIAERDIYEMPDACTEIC